MEGVFYAEYHLSFAAESRQEAQALLNDVIGQNVSRLCPERSSVRVTCTHCGGDGRVGASVPTDANQEPCPVCSGSTVPGTISMCVREHHESGEVTAAEHFVAMPDRYVVNVLERLLEEAGGDLGTLRALLEQEIDAHRGARP